MYRNIYKKLYSITSKLQKTAPGIGFVKKALQNNVIPNFTPIKGQFLNKHEHIQGERKLMLSHLNRHVCNSKIQMKTHYEIDSWLLALVRFVIM